MAEQEPVEKENIVELHAIEHDKIPAKAAATRNSGRPNRLKQRKIDKRKTLKTDVFKVFLSCCTTVDFCLHAKNQFTRVHDIKKSAERALLKFQVE